MTREKSRVTRSRGDQAQAEAVSAINHKKHKVFWLTTFGQHMNTGVVSHGELLGRTRYSGPTTKQLQTNYPSSYKQRWGPKPY